LVLPQHSNIDYRLYHNNPWTDTRKGTCSSFDIFLLQPVNFFMQRFPGMTRPVADLLANRVFCILDVFEDDSARMEVRDFGAWARELPSLLDNPSRVGHKRVVSAGSIRGRPVTSSMPISHRPCSRPPSSCGTPLRTPAIQVRSLSRAPSLGPAYEIEPSELSTVIDQQVEEQEESELKEDRDLYLDADTDGTDSRSQSNNKRRKRGARSKQKETSDSPRKQDETLETLAAASQSLQTLVRELSKPTTRVSAKNRRDVYEPVSMYPVPMALTSSKGKSQLPKPIPKRQPSAPAPTQASAIAKKPSKWKLSFGRKSSTPSVSEDSPVVPSARASEITTLLMSLTRTPRRRPRRDPVHMQSRSDGNSALGAIGESCFDPNTSFEPSDTVNDERAVSQASPRSGYSNTNATNSTSAPTFSRYSFSERPVSTAATSVFSSNWRSSSADATSSTSSQKFSMYSSSERSASTAATSVSSSSWRSPSGASSSPLARPERIPQNIKGTYFCCHSVGEKSYLLSLKF
jgi:hypothetical protein